MPKFPFEELIIAMILFSFIIFMFIKALTGDGLRDNVQSIGQSMMEDAHQWSN